MRRRCVPVCGRREGEGSWAAPLGLLAQLEEGVLDLYIGQGINLGQGRQADVGEAVLARHMRKAIDGPRRLMVAQERVRRRRRSRTALRRRPRLERCMHIHTCTYTRCQRQLTPMQANAVCMRLCVRICACGQEGVTSAHGPRLMALNTCWRHASKSVQTHTSSQRLGKRSRHVDTVPLISVSTGLAAWATVADTRARTRGACVCERKVRVNVLACAAPTIGAHRDHAGQQVR
jgi:hypothetical protein